jgi:hypothetical protein
MKFGCAIYSNSPTVVMFLNGTKYKVEVDVTYDDYCAMPVDAVVKIERTDEALSLSGKHNDYYKFGGYPIFIQTPCEPIGEMESLILISVQYKIIGATWGMQIYSH